MNLPSSHIPPRRSASIHSLTPSRDLLVKPTSPGKSAAAAAAAATAATATKSKRVRTGCLTCRERHLKCDEGLPNCLNCRKSSRECKRGVRLNFIDIQVKKPPYMPPTVEWSSNSKTNQGRSPRSTWEVSAATLTLISKPPPPPPPPPPHLLF
ncbi:Adhesion and hyphal regulator 1, partial [Colletotrichum tanaceti]